MSLVKENFLRTKLVLYLQQINTTTPPKWGKMNVQQMIEHIAREGFETASGKRKFEKIYTPAERLPKMREFMLSDKPFKENTINPLMPEEPIAVQYNTVQASIGYLQQEIIYFFQAFENNPSLTTHNPFFGDLNFEENVQLLHKHALHHLLQFEVMPLSV